METYTDKKRKEKVRRIKKAFKDTQKQARQDDFEQNRLFPKPNVDIAKLEG